MARLLEYLEVSKTATDSVYRCLKCGHVLGSAKEDYKKFSKKRTVPIWYNEPEFLTQFSKQSNTFALREYYCPNCAVMFEVDMVQKDEPQIRSIELKTP